MYARRSQHRKQYVNKRKNSLTSITEDREWQWNVNGYCIAQLITIINGTKYVTALVSVIRFQCV